MTAAFEASANAWTQRCGPAAQVALCITARKAAQFLKACHSSQAFD